MKINTLVVSTFFLIAATGCSDSNNSTKSVASRSPIVTASSKIEKLGPEGLFEAAQPGWHSASPPTYPESLTVDLLAPQEVKFIGLLQQDGQLARAPKSLRIETSSDGKTWTEAGGADDACAPNKPDGWVNIDLAKPITAQHIRIVIFSNCGDTQFLTLRGLRVG